MSNGSATLALGAQLGLALGMGASLLWFLIRSGVGLRALRQPLRAPLEPRAGGEAPGA